MAKPANKTRVNKKEQRRLATEKAKKMKNLQYAGIALVFIALFIGVGIYRQATVPSTDPLADIRESNGDSIASTSDSELEKTLGFSLTNVKGDLAAPVSIVEYADFGCPACRAWHNAGAMEQIQDQFGDQVSFTFRHFPVITRESPKAAEATQCAADQGAFWAYHDYVYDRVATPLTDDKLIAAASVVGLNNETFAACLTSGEKRAYVDRDHASALAAGARGTPTFLINGQLVSSNPAEMIAVIDGLLSE